MIAYLKGVVLHKTENYLVLQVGGVGYKLFVTSESLATETGAELALYTYLKSGDDGMSLFGLPDHKTLEFFELLISVSGVGPKSALGILNKSHPDMIQSAIAHGDVSLFTSIAGIGKKTAERIILELKNKVSALAVSGAHQYTSEVFDALVSLGYRPAEIKAVMSHIDASLPLQAQIKQALNTMKS